MNRGPRGSAVRRLSSELIHTQLGEEDSGDEPWVLLGLLSDSEGIQFDGTPADNWPRGVWFQTNLNLVVWAEELAVGYYGSVR